MSETCIEKCCHMQDTDFLLAVEHSLVPAGAEEPCCYHVWSGEAVRRVSGQLPGRAGEDLNCGQWRRGSALLWPRSHSALHHLVPASQPCHGGGTQPGTWFDSLRESSVAGPSNLHATAEQELHVSSILWAKLSRQSWKENRRISKLQIEVAIYIFDWGVWNYQH